MREFVDLRGASGSLYRFRLWPEGGAHPPIAGNYIVLREDEGGVKVLLAGVTSDLSQAAFESRKALAKDPAGRLYTRLNVARAVGPGLFIVVVYFLHGKTGVGVTFLLTAASFISAVWVNTWQL